MANKIQIKRGEGTPTILDYGEIAFSNGTDNFYVGDKTGNIVEFLDKNKVPNYPVNSEEKNIFGANYKFNVMYEYGNVKRYGALNDGVFDNSDIIEKALNYCINTTTPLFFPNGTYAVKRGYIPATTKPVIIIGESSHGVILKNISTSNVDYVFDFKTCKIVYAVNLTSSTMGFNVMDNTKYGDADGGKAWALELRDKDFYLENVLYTGDQGHTSYYQYINSPCPKDYNRYSDGNYAKYPLEITNGSGYNAININNFATLEDGSVGKPADNSAIGIVDRVINSAGVIFVDMNGRRSFIKLNRSESPIKSNVMEGTVFEVHHNGHVAIGCSTDESEFGYSALKIRDNSPTIELIDFNNSDIRGNIGMVKTNDGEQISLKIGNDGIVFTKKASGNEISGFRYAPIVGGLHVRATPSDIGNTGLILNNNQGNVRTLITDSRNRIRVLPTTETNIENGITLQPVNGNTTNFRPSLTSSNRDVGFMYFDTTLNKPIWWTGSKWVDATGGNV